MRTIVNFLGFFWLMGLLVACDDASGEADALGNGLEGMSVSDGAYSETGGGSPGNGSGNGQGGTAGLVTAAEWNDLEHWSFWEELLQTDAFANKPDYWKFYPNNRLAVRVFDAAGNPISDQSVTLQNGDRVIWEAKTDNFGSAELFVGLRQQTNKVDLSTYGLYVAGMPHTAHLKWFQEGINEYRMNGGGAASDKVELAFVVDATGSMGDELEFLKEDLLSVIERVKGDAPELDIATASVFYRDTEDDYLVRHSGFARSVTTTLNFISEQSADGGGDFPEAVHSALNTALNELQWSGTARTRIAFLLLDAPPHNNANVISNLQDAIVLAAKKGIKIIPITASGIDQETEYLMRTFAIATNGTYVFITDDSGIGNDHLEASVGEYQVEKLNDLMVRLIGKYAQ
ncbi:vWA domain-containing protein [Maribacter sp. 2307ULW6-5]|uniref:vWA domain-containing protein n=1 Tax=Maribacter sp. 2307ULW6-5 TaxID=3386275 RepID=UPI0039BCB613